MLTPADDQMVEDADVEKRQRLLQAFGDLAVCFARLRVPARVVVKEDDGDRVELKSALSNNSRVNFAAIDGAGEEVLGSQDVVLGVEEDDAEHFVRQVGAAGDQVVAGLVGAVNSALALKALFEDGGCCEENPFLVHLKLILDCSVLGALHRFLSTSALCASWEPAGEAFGSTAPGSEHRWRRAAEGRNRASASRRRPALAVGTAEQGFPLRGPALVETAPCMP